MRDVYSLEHSALQVEKTFPIRVAETALIAHELNRTSFEGLTPPGDSETKEVHSLGKAV